MYIDKFVVDLKTDLKTDHIRYVWHELQKKENPSTVNGEIAPWNKI